MDEKAFQEGFTLISEYNKGTELEVLEWYVLQEGLGCPKNPCLNYDGIVIVNMICRRKH